MPTENISPFSYGILALTNPDTWPNEAENDSFSHLVTGKSVYVWPLIFASYVWHLEERKGVHFPSELKKIDLYISRHFEQFLAENPIDFSNAGSQYVRSKPGSFQSLRKGFGAPAKKIQIPEAERLLTRELSSLEVRGLIVDPFSTTIAGITLAVLGAVPYSFTKRTVEGDETFLSIKATLWEFESLSKGDQKELRFHFFMEKAIAHLKKHLKLIVDGENAQSNDDPQS